MATIKNVSGEDLIVPALGDRLVSAGQEVDVHPDDVWAFTQQSIWEPVGKPAKDAHTKGEKARDERVKQERDAIDSLAIVESERDAPGNGRE